MNTLLLTSEPLISSFRKATTTKQSKGYEGIEQCIDVVSETEDISDLESDESDSSNY